ncbi:MAG: peptidoglycan DD-metalloendopeptidase family protein [Actinobacteria bacterium]|nr:peptidoglycan DD-metalloendopeptidase family protein [Actinomycetota bacterium]
MRALWAILAGMALLVPAVPSTSVRADESDDAAQQAAEEIADARERANAAADALFQAESDLDQLELSQQALESDIAVLQSQIDALRATVEKVAINRFTRSGTDSLPLLTGFRSAGEQAQVAVLIDVVNETSAEDFDEFDALNAELEDKRAELDQAEVDAEAARDELDRRREDALAEIERLKEVEAQRLEDEAVRTALAAEEAERRRQEDAAADALRAQAAAQDSVGSQSQLGANVPVDSTQIDGDDIDSSGATNKSTGGTGGGLTGNTGAGARPGGAAGDLAGPGWVCPVQGPVGFGDTWGAPRSGGRSHQGVDMIANRGVPLVAVVDGFAQSKVNTLGGNTVQLAGADGNKYYYAHLDSWATLGQVTAGTVIGYVGDTGNAKFSTPHLHFEIHPGGGAAVNPYATVRNHC